MKGAYKEECNRTACQKPNSAFYYNHSTREHYCRECAMAINEANYGDSMRMFGHELCTYVKERPDDWIERDRPWEDYPVGTLAESKYDGHWVKNDVGWIWLTGISHSSAPRRDATGKVLLPLIKSDEQENLA